MSLSKRVFGVTGFKGRGTMRSTRYRRNAAATRGAAENKDIMRLVGDEELISAFKYFKDSSVNKIMRPALSKAIRIARAEAKALAPKGKTGLLRKSLRYKVGIHKPTGRIWSMVYVSRTVKGGNAYSSKHEHTPYKIAHLVEFGTKTSKPKPFMTLAMKNKKMVMFQAIRMKAREKFEIETVAAARKGKTL